MEVELANAQNDRTSVKYALRKMLSYIGEDPDREGLQDTPDRIIRSWDELFGGYKIDPVEYLEKTFQETQNYDEMIVLKSIEFWSTCEHHLLPFYGKMSVGYIPDLKVVGISKLARVVEVFARRLQIQERLTEEIANTIQTVLSPKGVGVLVEAKHLCMVARGVQKHDSSLVTSSLKGAILEDHRARKEFMDLIKT